MITSADIADQVATVIEAGEGADTIDQDAIVRDIVAEHGLVDIDTIDSEAFWAIVARHDESQLVTPLRTVRMSSEDDAVMLTGLPELAGTGVRHDGPVVHLPAAALSALAGLRAEDDWHFDGQAIWAAGDGYPVS